MKKISKFLVISVLAMTMCFTNLGSLSALTQTDYEASTLNDTYTYSRANVLLGYSFQEVGDYPVEAELAAALEQAVADVDAVLTKTMEKTIADFTTDTDLSDAIALARCLDDLGLTLSEAETLFVAHNDAVTNYSSNLDGLKVSYYKYDIYDFTVMFFSARDYGFDTAEINALAEDVVARNFPTAISLLDASTNYDNVYTKFVDASDLMDVVPNTLVTKADFEAMATAVNAYFAAFGFTAKYYVNGAETTLVDLYMYAEDTISPAKYELGLSSTGTPIAVAEGTIEEIWLNLGVTLNGETVEVGTAPVPTSPTATSNAITTPVTGDESNIAMMAVLGLASLACLVTLRKRVTE